VIIARIINVGAKKNKNTFLFIVLILMTTNNDRLLIDRAVTVKIKNDTIFGPQPVLCPMTYNDIINNKLVVRQTPH
jgi:hypothetical protein